jgi:tripartite-type tricarboxylate transporter receptor subunit TctC
MMFRSVLVLSVFLATTLGGENISAQTNIRQMRIVVPYSPGGASDGMTRLISQHVTETGGPQIVIDTRPGGAGVVGVMAVKQAAGDGTTLLLVDQATMGANVAMIKDLPYDVFKDFKPITPLWSFYTVMAIPGSMPANTVKELIELAKKTPGGLSYASQGSGSGGHLQGEMLRISSNAPLVHVPYRGSSGLTDLIAGRVAFIFMNYFPMEQYIGAGTLKALAVSGPRRLEVLPNVPTLVEAGFPEVQIDTWFGLAAPAATPDSVINRINQMFVSAVRSVDITERMKSQGLIPTTLTPAEFAEMIRHNLGHTREMVKETGVTME